MSVHFVLQGKGGVGKTLTSNLLAQYLKDETNKAVLCIDTDPVNRSFSGYASLQVRHFNIMENDNVKTSLFDDLVELLIQHKDHDIIIDNGASGFIPLTRYLIENEVLSLLTEQGIEVCIHTVVTGGESMKDTLLGLSTLLDAMENVSLFVWLNEFFGPIRSGDKNFPDMKIYKDRKSDISGVILIPDKGELFREDLKSMLSSKQTFEDLLGNETTRIMTRSRMKVLRDVIYSNLSQVLTSSDVE